MSQEDREAQMSAKRQVKRDAIRTKGGWQARLLEKSERLADVAETKQGRADEVLAESAAKREQISADYDARKQARYDEQFLKPEVVCQHCGVKGGVEFHEKTVRSGATAGKFLTRGVLALASGPKKVETVRECFCRNCEMRWTV